LTTARPGGPDVSLIIVHYNGAARLRACLDSLLADVSTKREIFVVDNASEEESTGLLDELENAGDEITLIRSEENLGYAGGVNLALPHCRGRYVGVLNMDIVAESGWLEPLVDFLDHHPDTGAVNPLLLLGDGCSINAAGQHLHITGLGFNRYLGKSCETAGSEPFRISGIQGAAFLLRRELLQRIGGMDASGFLYHEDVNLSWLVGLMGYELYCIPRARVRHDYFLSMHAEKFHLLERNRIGMLFAYLEPGTAWRLALRLGFSELLVWTYALLRGPAFLRAKARSYGWLREARPLLEERRCLAGRLRMRSDREYLATLERAYPWRQLLDLAGERGQPRRPLAPGLGQSRKSNHQ
jgi:GT2 family glycosyltransferase